MFSHIMIGANDIEKSKIFYDEILGVLGCKPGRFFPNLTGQTRYFYFHNNMTFCISEPIDDEPATHGNGTTIGFSVKDPDEGNAWHAAGIKNGGTTCESPPGIREGDGYKMYLAYLRDPSGNKLCGFLNFG
ncbi:VOC family protein [SAR86 cluster bacterium]|nr:VOC family protein [SAR86 cluster bacterium]